MECAESPEVKIEREKLMICIIAMSSINPTAVVVSDVKSVNTCNQSAVGSVM